MNMAGIELTKYKMISYRFRVNPLVINIDLGLIAFMIPIGTGNMVYYSDCTINIYNL